MASSGLLVPAMGLPGEGAGEATCGRAGTRGDSSETEGAETDMTGELGTGGVSGTDDKTMAGTGDEARENTEKRSGEKIRTGERTKSVK